MNYDDSLRVLILRKVVFFKQPATDKYIDVRLSFYVRMVFYVTVTDDKNKEMID